MVEIWYEFASTYSHVAVHRVEALAARAGVELAWRVFLLGIPFRRPSQFPRNGLLAARAALVAEAEPWIGRFVRSVYRANFVDDQDIADPARVRALLAAAGCADPDGLLARASSAENKEHLRTRNHAAVAHGIFGAPSFVVADELFWGNDRLEDALAWSKRA